MKPDPKLVLEIIKQANKINKNTKRSKASYIVISDETINDWANRTISEMRNHWEERRRDGDIARVAIRTNFSRGHVSNMVNGRRVMREEVARELYRTSRNRVTNNELRRRYPEVRNVEFEFSTNR